MLQVKRTEWFGKNLAPHPMIKFYCVDNNDDDGEEICLMVSPREKQRFAKQFFSANGGFKKGRMNIGRRFQLLDYTTRVMPRDRIHNGDEEIVHFEKMSWAPVKRRQTKMLGFLRANHPSLRGKCST